MRPRYLQILALLFCAFIFCGCEKVYYLLQKEGAEEKQIVGEALPLEANAKVQEVQKLLKLYGYPIGNIDGKIGPATRAAIVQFQRNNDLEETRFVDKATWEKLHMFDACGLIKDGNIQGRAVQQALVNAGFKLGRVDGVMGAQTKKALVDFQKAQGLRGDGVIGLQTMTFLSKYLQPQPESSGHEK